MGYTITQVSKLTHLTAHALRYYEKEGLLSPVARNESGTRQYSDHDLEWLGLICCLKNTGMSLKQIKAFVSLSAQGDQTLKQRCDMLVSHKKCVEMQIEEMQQHLEKVSQKIIYFAKQYERNQEENALV